LIACTTISYDLSTERGTSASNREKTRLTTYAIDYFPIIVSDAADERIINIYSFDHFITFFFNFYHIAVHKLRNFTIWRHNLRNFLIAHYFCLFKSHDKNFYDKID